jgi:hypothetical protein
MNYLNKTIPLPALNALRKCRLLYVALFSKYGRVPGAINYLISAVLLRKQITESKKKAKELPMLSELGDKLHELKTEGFCKLKLNELVSHHEADSLIDSLIQTANEFGAPTHADLINKFGVQKTKSYFYDIAKKNQDIRERIMQFASGQKQIQLAAKYLGQMPLIEYVSYIYTPPTSGTKLIAAQGWHLDRENKSKLKIFMSPFKISVSSGPTTLLSLKHSIGKPYPNYPWYFDDEEALAAGISVEDKIPLLSNVGELFMADTSKLFHYGARHQTQPRFLVIISYCPLESRIDRNLNNKVIANSIKYNL